MESGFSDEQVSQHPYSNKFGYSEIMEDVGHSTCHIANACLEDREEIKLDHQIRQLSINQPKSSKHEQSQPVGGLGLARNNCTLGKNIPTPHRIEIAHTLREKNVIGSHQR
jgi:hypothetical protein